METTKTGAKASGHLIEYLYMKSQESPAIQMLVNFFCENASQRDIDVMEHHSGNAYEKCIGEKIACPICGDTCCHIMGVNVKQKETETRIRRDGTNEVPANNESRGSSVSILFDCESGHNFTKRYAFYKGETFVKSFETEHLIESELWRD